MVGVLEETVLSLKHTQTTALSNRAKENLSCVAFKVHKALVHSLCSSNSTVKWCYILQRLTMWLKEMKGFTQHHGEWKRQRQNLDLTPMETLPISPLCLRRTAFPSSTALSGLTLPWSGGVEEQKHKMWEELRLWCLALLFASHQAEDKLPGLSETCKLDIMIHTAVLS